ncbi:MAG TPA: folate hydrolase, partial [Rudaea sp.]|nr:folate hydrolase [Rudaea sp.]
MTRKILRATLVLGGCLLTFGIGIAADTPVHADSSNKDSAMLGFSSDGANAQRALEQRFDAQLNPAELRKWMKQMASQPNHVGSPHDKANAEFMLANFRAWGWDAHIETFDVLYPTP